MGRVADLAIGFPGYWGKAPRENGYLSEILREAGYATYAVGKWHLSPEDETHMAASRRTWPLARGFDRWYGFHGGETHQFVPALYHDNHAVRPRAFDRGRLSPQHGPGGPGHPDALRPTGRRSRPSLLPLPVHGRLPLAAPGPPTVDRAHAGPLRSRLGRLAGEDLRPAARERGHPPRHPAVTPAALGARLGRPAARGAPAGRSVHGVLRRLPLAHRRPDRPPGRLPRRARRARRHGHRRGLGQRCQRRRRARPDPSTTSG